MILARTTLAAATAVFFAVACSPGTAPPISTQSVTRTTQTAVRAAADTGTAPATFTIFPSLVIGGQQLVPAPQGTITVDSTAGVDRTLLITSSNPAVAKPTVATVTVPAGSNRTAVEIDALLVSAVSTATISVSGAGVSKSIDMTVYPRGATLPPPILASIAANPATVPAGTSSTVTVKLTSPAPAGGLLVALFCQLPLNAQIQPTVVVPAGGTSASVPITSSIGFPNSTTTSLIQAEALNSNVGNGFNVVTGAVGPPFAIRSVVLNPTTVVGGNSVSGTVTMTAAAPTGGSLITLQSTDTTVAATPASVTVSAGATSASFTVATKTVAAASTANIAGGFNGGFLTTTLHVNPVTAPPPGATLATPTLLSPAADARFAPGATAAFDWSDVGGASDYTLQVSSSDKFTSFVVNASVTGSAFSTTSLPTSTLWWRVRANSAAITAGSFSASRRFEVK